MTMEVYIVPSAGLSLSQVIWRRYHRPSTGIIEKILEANPGLYLDVEDLTPGRAIKLPSIEAETEVVQPITLWG